MKTWKSELTADDAKVRTLLASIPDAQSSYRELRPDELESKIIAVYRSRAEIEQMREKYTSVLAADERKRK